MHWYLHQRKHRYEARAKYVRFLESKGIKCSNCFFTLFDNIPNRNYTIYPNKFKNISNQISLQKGNEVVLVIGPIFEKIPELNHISIENIEAIFWKQLSILKNRFSDVPILFIPHGRDTNTHIRDFCEILGIKYTKIPEAIEWYVLHNNIQPIAIYGQVSTALFTLKKLFPQTYVVNWFLNKSYDNPNYYVEKRKTEYYSKCGIHKEDIRFPKLTFKEKTNNIIINIQSLVEWCKDRFL